MRKKLVLWLWFLQLCSVRGLIKHLTQLPDSLHISLWEEGGAEADYSTSDTTCVAIPLGQTLSEILALLDSSLNGFCVIRTARNCQLPWTSPTPWQHSKSLFRSASKDFNYLYAFMVTETGGGGVKLRRTIRDTSWFLNKDNLIHRIGL